VLFLGRIRPAGYSDPQSRLPLGLSLGQLNARGQEPSLLDTHYMKMPTPFCGRVAIMDHGEKILALDTPGQPSRRGIDADTIVNVTRHRRTRHALAGAHREGFEGADPTPPDRKGRVESPDVERP